MSGAARACGTPDGAGRGLRAGPGAADGVRGGRDGEPAAARLAGGHLRGAEADKLAQGAGDRAGRPGEHLADLVRGEGRVRELAQVLLDQVTERAGPGRRGAPTAGGGLQHPPPLGSLLPHGLQGSQDGLQVPGREPAQAVRFLGDQVHLGSRPTLQMDAFPCGSGWVMVAR